MFTTTLAYVAIVSGVAAIGAGAWGMVTLLGNGNEGPRPLRYLAMTFAMLAGGIGLIGIGQALRLLLVINAQF